MTASSTLLIYLNSDVGMERPYRTALPASVDTLAELCQYLTSRIPPRPGEDTVGRGYRFLYSVLGKPLWRVKECVDAGTIVLSVGPGFLARRPTAITGSAAPVDAATLADMTTPDRLAATTRGAGSSSSSNDKVNVRNGLPHDASPSASPPVKIPAGAFARHAPFTDVHANGAATATTTTRTAAAGASSAAVAATYAQNSTTGGLPRSSLNPPSVGAATGEGGRESVDAAWPPAPSVRRPSQTDEQERLVSITLNTAARGTRASSGGPMSQSTPFTTPTATAAAAGAGTTPAVRLFAPSGANPSAMRGAAAISMPNESVLNAQQQQQAQQVPMAAPPSAASTAATSGAVPRGMVFLAHETHSLPPRPSFVPAATAMNAVLPHLQPLPSTAISSSLQYLLLRKWGAYQKLHSMAPADLVAGEALSQQFNAISAACSGGDRAFRVVVSGPPRSGVSTTAAFLLRHWLRTLQFQPQHKLHNTLVIALDFHLLFGPQVSSAPGQQHHAPPRVLLDLASLYQLVVRSVFDAVVAQRPVLREAGPLLGQLWDLVVKPNAEPHAAPNFTTYAQAAALVGGDVLARWTRLAQQISPILHAACRTPEVVELRDAALDLIFYAIPAEIAASLNFSGLLYAIDGAEVLTLCYAQRVTRPAGDLGPLLQALATDARTHLVLSWPATLSPRSLFIPDLTAHISTIGLVTRDALNRLHLPLVIRSLSREYPVEAFLGCPGYLTHLYTLVRPFRRNLTTPTTAYSAYYQQHYERSAADAYAVRIDTDEVSRALDQLMALVQALPVA